MFNATKPKQDQANIEHFGLLVIVIIAIIL